MRKLSIFFLLIFSLATASAQTPYDRLELKANRFYSQKEWAQAAATFYQMLEQRPDISQTYGKAIVANAMRGDSVAEMDLMGRAMKNKIPFDSVLSRVMTESFSLGRSNLYGNFLLHVREAYPWMRRPADNYLLRYYIFRRDGAKMMEYSSRMLQGAPDNVGFLSSYARGAMLCGEFDKGIATYKQILDLVPDDYDALLTLGNYYNEKGDTAQALPYLRRAEAIRATPHLTSTIARITAHPRK